VTVKLIQDHEEQVRMVPSHLCTVSEGGDGCQREEWGLLSAETHKCWQGFTSYQWRGRGRPAPWQG
jgi:hypothetical protein